MLRQFQVTPELQQFLAGLGSKALTNVVWDLSFVGDVPVLPLSPSSVRRSLFFSKFGGAEFDVLVKNLDGSNSVQVTGPR